MLNLAEEKAVEEAEPIEVEMEIEVELASEAPIEQMSLTEADASNDDEAAVIEEPAETMTFEDISSGRENDTDEAEEAPTQEDGFVLDVSAMDLSEEEPENDFSDFHIDQVRHFGGAEVAEEKAEERPSSFKSFFKKK